MIQVNVSTLNLDFVNGINEPATAAERRQIMSQLEQKWSRSVISQRHPKVRFEVLDATEIQNWARP